MSSFLFALGFGLWGAAVAVALWERHARKSWLRTMGEVVDQVLQKPAGSHTRYVHVIRFENGMGESFELEGVQTRFQYYKLGQAAPVLFDPADPRRAVPDEFTFRWSRRVWWLIIRDPWPWPSGGSSLVVQPRHGKLRHMAELRCRIR